MQVRGVAEQRSLELIPVTQPRVLPEQIQRYPGKPRRDFTFGELPNDRGDPGALAGACRTDDRDRPARGVDILTRQVAFTHRARPPGLRHTAVRTPAASQPGGREPLRGVTTSGAAEQQLARPAGVTAVGARHGPHAASSLDAAYISSRHTRLDLVKPEGQRPENGQGHPLI